ncbi:MAG: pyridoxal phosphate-dependent aminotransferase [Thermoguttaceae bacterium]
MSLDEYRFSPYGASSVAPSPVNRMMASFAVDFRDGYDINLGVGYVNERTIPRHLIGKALDAVIQDPTTYRAAFNYGNPEGSANCIEAIRRFLVKDAVGGLSREVLDRNRIVVGASGVTSLLEGIARVLQPGVVVTTDPQYYIYCNFLERCGYTILPIPEDADGIRIDVLQRRLESLRQPVSFFYIVTVNNPTCSILSNERRKRLLEIVHDLGRATSRNIPIFFDTAYELLIHDPAVERPESALLHDRHAIAYELGTLSKILAPGLRIGYMIGPDTSFLRAMVQRINDMGFSAPVMNQEIASYLLDHHASEQVRTVNAGYREKAQKTREWISRYLEPHLEECTGGSAGFYYYLTFKNCLTEEGSLFFNYLARTTGIPSIDGDNLNENQRVVYIPGDFCVHPQGDLAQKGKRQLRISYGFEELDRIEQGIRLMGEAVEYAASRLTTSGAAARIP